MKLNSKETDQSHWQKRFQDRSSLWCSYCSLLSCMSTIKKEQVRTKENEKLGEERSLRNLILKSCAGKDTVIIKEVSTIKERLLAPHCNNRKGVLRVRPNPAKPATCERRGPRSFMFLEIIDLGNFQHLQNAKDHAPVVQWCQAHPRLAAELGNNAIHFVLVSEPTKMQE